MVCLGLMHPKEKQQNGTKPKLDSEIKCLLIADLTQSLLLEAAEVYEIGCLTQGIYSQENDNAITQLKLPMLITKNILMLLFGKNK